MCPRCGITSGYRDSCDKVGGRAARLVLGADQAQPLAPQRQDLQRRHRLRVVDQRQVRAPGQQPFGQVHRKPSMIVNRACGISAWKARISARVCSRASVGGIAIVICPTGSLRRARRSSLA